MFEEVNRYFAVWVSKNQEAIAGLKQIAANIQQIGRGFAEALTQLSLQFQETLKRSDHVAQLGWTFPAEMSLADLAELSKLSNPADADAYVLHWFEGNDPQLEAMEQRLTRNPRLASFKTLLSAML